MNTHDAFWKVLKKKQKRDVSSGRENSNLGHSIVYQRGGVIRFSLMLSSEDGSKKKICFNQVKPNTNAKPVVGIFVAGGSEIDKAVYEANVRCITIESGDR